MASIQKRNCGWRAVIRRRGRPTLIKAFATKREAEIWGRHIESQFDRGIVEDLRAAKKTIMAELFERYALETAGVKKSASRERHILALLTRHFGKIALAELTTQDIAEFRNMRLEVGRSPATVTNNIHLLSAVVEKAMGEWGY
ncbi:MAG: site-specific integrase, partial [Betaproteobacteria bacterium]|nr:site-specific integrase [Betaproteobacteria bacterium]